MNADIMEEIKINPADPLPEPVEEFDMAKLLSEQENTAVSETSADPVLMATVISMVKEGVLVDIGQKREVLIPREELPEPIPFKVGESVAVIKVSKGIREGYPTVSWKAAKDRIAWEEIEQLFKRKIPVLAEVKGETKGGLVLECENGLRAFLPLSQIDVRPSHDLKKWKGQKVTGYVVQYDPYKNNLILSRKAWLTEEIEKKKSELLSVLKVGDVRKGKVTGITSYGAFVDIGGMEGLLHIGELDWFHVKKVSDLLRVGQEIEVKVIKFDPETHKVSLSRKELIAHPWDGIEEKFPAGSVVKGKITGLTDFGAFIEIAPHIEGLVHLSEISWKNDFKKPREVLKTGEMVEVKILKLDREKEKLSLSIKRASQSPWAQLQSQYPVGSVVKVKISSLVPFGAFARLPEGPEGLIHISDFSWVKRVENPQEMLQAGQEVEVKVLEMDPAKEKISFGLKQCCANPYEKYHKRSKIKGKIARITDNGAFVGIESDLEAFIPYAEISSEKFEKISNILSVGEEIEAVVILAEPRERKLHLSIRQLELELQRAATKKYSKKSTGLALGQILDS